MDDWYEMIVKPFKTNWNPRAYVGLLTDQNCTAFPMIHAHMMDDWILNQLHHAGLEVTRIWMIDGTGISWASRVSEINAYMDDWGVEFTFTILVWHLGAYSLLISNERTITLKPNHVVW